MKDTFSVISIVGLVAMGIGGAVASPDDAAMILSFSGGLVVVLITAMRTHGAVNSKMDKLLTLTAKDSRREGLDQGREETANKAAKERRN